MVYYAMPPLTFYLRSRVSHDEDSAWKEHETANQLSGAKDLSALPCHKDVPVLRLMGCLRAQSPSFCEQIEL